MSLDDFLLMSRHLRSIAIGSGPREIWVYFDPNCIFCNRLYASLKPYENQVKTHWIPVGFLMKDDSLKKATGILQAKNPVRALRENEDRFDTGSEEGGYPIPSDISVPAERAVATSTVGLGQATGELATPTIVFVGTDGKPHSVMGLPEDLRTFLSGVKG
ncbi:thioredoxin fold domain-containing protein [Leptospirillum ferriphilum]|uniref:thioredoxin fold domain-containing protein n=1 Tax=Leptospirillum ferriphilum TaxID=178606 RepID=UPI0006B1A860|nr:thioredoxin fold domain-containing protein [Leptospirillum ferriphilum]